MSESHDLYRLIEHMTDHAAELGEVAAGLEGDAAAHIEGRALLMQAASTMVKASATATRALACIADMPEPEKPAAPSLHEEIERRPEQVLNAMLIAMHQELVEAKKQVAVTIADSKRLTKQAANERAQAEQWRERAKKAGAAEQRAQADQRAVSHASLADGLEEDAREQQSMVDQLTASLSRLNDRVQAAKREKNLLAARMERARAQRTIADTLAGISTSSAFDVMGRMLDRVERMEDEAHAAYEATKAIGNAGSDD